MKPFSYFEYPNPLTLKIVEIRSELNPNAKIFKFQKNVINKQTN